MGVKNLWSLLTPVAEKMPLWELHGKVIAIDLSGWVCDSENFNQNMSQKNMYLRNLFFRTCNLLLIGVIPIFVLDGEAPLLKYGAIEKRINGNKAPTKTHIVRKRLNSFQKQCEFLLNIMGVTCVYSPGEAEQLCAILNKNGVVSGIVTQDSDCFLYGARVVYRNFNASGNGSVDVYRMESIENNLNIGRNKMIALSLLCGCDYDEKGVTGIGKDTAIKFLQSLDDDSVLDRLRHWRSDTVLNSATMDIKSQTNEIKLELKIRNKAIENKSFPSEEIIEEFLKVPNYPKVSAKWILPDINAFINFASAKLCWEKEYAIEKFLPLLFRWHLMYDDKFQANVLMTEIIKKRVNKGIKCYEVKWNNYKITSIEPQTAVQRRYPNEVSIYEDMHTTSSKKMKKKITIHDSNLLEVTNKLYSMNISKKHRKSKKINEEKNSVKGPLDQFIMKEKIKDDSLTLSDFECDSVDLDMSDIINGIIT
ncbi:flap endonuclease GEN [Rhopalosiphum maidis]|uniref:flap endonuclease GEN n=1 Tax=Rhopalosiphum maidis TaxID=43146 RepID=UPI000EFDB68A|nr:flap endonuclease GEN [Rhopalosiphum maidis]XP_026806901.1 flap endonuclease GEN [Rhopalosiphum maidis]